ncbi:uncharacterized protein LOC116253727 [Nymphaea colorata]|nr:uncharacterized protein LOC116253727 [Nymphaea colorata]
MVEEEMDEEWVAMAMRSDAMVAEMLLRLRLPQAELPRFSQAAAAAASLPVRWGVVRKRARQPVARADGWCDREGDGKAEMEAAREKVASPTTPLSWSGGAGSAGSGDGSDSSSHPRVKAAEVLQTAGGGGGGGDNGGAGFGCVVRLKAAAREANALRLPSKRPAKKKTIAVLKDEENKLLIERTNLENDMERLMKTYMSLVKQNKRLKMIKLPPKDVSNGKPEILASKTSEQAPQEAVLPAEAADLDPVTPPSASGAKADFLATGAAMQEVHDSALLTNTEPLSRTANATHQSHAARETCSFSPVPGCGEAFFIPDLNLPVDVSFAGDAA